MLWNGSGGHFHHYSCDFRRDITSNLLYIMQASHCVSSICLEVESGSKWNRGHTLAIDFWHKWIILGKNYSKHSCRCLGRARSPQRAADGYGDPSLPLRLWRIFPADKNFIKPWWSWKRFRFQNGFWRQMVFCAAIRPDVLVWARRWTFYQCCRRGKASVHEGIQQTCRALGYHKGGKRRHYRGSAGICTPMAKSDQGHSGSRGIQGQTWDVKNWPSSFKINPWNKFDICLTVFFYRVSYVSIFMLSFEHL